jgi:hypothetical protein
MNCDRYADAIAELVDGTLTGDGRRALEAHLDGCAACRTLVSDLQQIRRVAGTLEPLDAPPAVWARVSGEIARAPRTRVGLRALVFQPQWLAAAAAVVAAAGVTAALLLRGAPGPSPVIPAPAGPATPVAEAGNVPVDDIVQRVEGELKQAEQHYQAALADLDRIAASGNSALDPKVTAALRQNVALVDKAIADSRAALAEEPGNVPARESLFDALRRKVSLLQDTIALVSEMSRGNQAGTAAIVEGLKKS